ncbi:MAG: hypothetical protein ACTTKP_08730 [Catonella sp.]|uniref:hypothetical protein n=1 Tax=Catonella sp. TaxID=2382125 RepID=UPI003F9F8CBA
MNLRKDNRGIAKSTLVIVLAIIGALVIGGAIFASSMLKKDPFTRLMLGYMKVYENREQRAVVDVSFSMDKENAEVKKLFEQIPAGSCKSSNEQLMDFVSKILPKIGLKYSVIANTKTEPLAVGASVSVLYDNKELADAGVTARPWETTVYSKALLEKPLYMDLKERIKEETGFDISGIKLKEYIDILYEKDEFINKLPSSKYFELIKNTFKDKLVAEGSDKVVLNLKYADSIKFSQEFCKIGAKDEDLKNFIIRKFDKIIDTMIKNGDYKLTGLSEEDFKKQAEEGKKQLTDKWETSLNTMADAYSSEEFNKAIEQLGDMAIKYTFTFKGDEIVKVDGNMNVQGIDIKFAVTMEKYSEDGFTFADASNSDSLTENFDSNSIMFTLLGKANEILTGDAYKNMEADLIKTAKESLASEDAAMLEAGLKQASAMTGMGGN